MAAACFFVLGVLLTTDRDMGGSFAAAAADFLALGVGAAELKVFLDRRHDGLVVTERTFLQILQTSVADILLLLQISQFFQEPLVVNAIELSRFKPGAAASRAHDVTSGISDLACDVDFDAGVASVVRYFAMAVDLSVDGEVVKARLAFCSLASSYGMLQVFLFFHLHLGLQRALVFVCLCFPARSSQLLVQFRPPSGYRVRVSIICGCTPTTGDDLGVPEIGQADVGFEQKLFFGEDFGNESKCECREVCLQYGLDISSNVVGQSFSVSTLPPLEAAVDAFFALAL